jgi:hypothetical protein
VEKVVEISIGLDNGDYTVWFQSYPVTKIDTIECDRIDIDDLVARTRDAIEYYLASLAGAAE